MPWDNPDLLAGLVAAYGLASLIITAWKLRRY